jgi:hypothetical protein
MARILIDLGFTHSFVSPSFACHLGKEPELLDFLMMVDILVGDSLVTDLVYRSCVVQIADRDLLVDLILLDIQDFDVILGMDWLSTYHDSVDCYSKCVTFHIPNQSEFHFKGIKEASLSLISAMRAYCLIRKGVMPISLMFLIVNQSYRSLKKFGWLRNFLMYSLRICQGCHQIWRLNFPLIYFRGQPQFLNHLIE